LTEFSIEGGRAIRIAATTTGDNESVAVFMTSLERSQRFRNVDLSVSERQMIGPQAVTRFTLTGELEGEPAADAFRNRPRGAR
jgi:proteasome lid subunit RPN8/RPN11